MSIDGAALDAKITKAAERLWQQAYMPDGFRTARDRYARLVALRARIVQTDRYAPLCGDGEGGWCYGQGPVWCSVSPSEHKGWCQVHAAHVELEAEWDRLREEVGP